MENTRRKFDEKGYEATLEYKTVDGLNLEKVIFKTKKCYTASGVKEIAELDQKISAAKDQRKKLFQENQALTNNMEQQTHALKEILEELNRNKKGFLSVQEVVILLGLKDNMLDLFIQRLKEFPNKNFDIQNSKPSSAANDKQHSRTGLNGYYSLALAKDQQNLNSTLKSNKGDEAEDKIVGPISDNNNATPTRYKL